MDQARRGLWTGNISVCLEHGPYEKNLCRLCTKKKQVSAVEVLYSNGLTILYAASISASVSASISPCPIGDFALFFPNWLE